MNKRAPFWVIAMVCGNLVWLAMATVLLVGIENTPYDSRDSLGRPMGFNDKLSPEHYTIIVRNFQFHSVFDVRYAFGWAIFCAQVAGLMIVGGKLFASKLAKIFFSLQLILLPFALFGVIVLVY